MQPMQAPASDEQAIRAIVQTMRDGWNAGDAAAYSSVFAADAGFVIIDGRYVQGKTAIEQGHAGIFQTIYKGSRLALEVRQVRLLRPDFAVCLAEGQLEFFAGAPMKRTATMSLLLENTSGGWRVVHHQNTPIQPMS